MSFSTAGLLKKSETLAVSNNNSNILGNPNYRASKSEMVETTKASKTIVLSNNPPPNNGIETANKGGKGSSCC